MVALFHASLENNACEKSDHNLCGNGGSSDAGRLASIVADPDQLFSGCSASLAQVVNIIIELRTVKVDIIWSVPFK